MKKLTHTITLEWIPIIDFDWTTTGYYLLYYDDAYCTEVYFDGNIFEHTPSGEPFNYVGEIQAICKYPEDLFPKDMPFKQRFNEILDTIVK